MKNLDLRVQISDKGLRYRDIAVVMGIRADSLSRMMRSELSPDQRSRIKNAIQVIEEARNG